MPPPFFIFAADAATPPRHFDGAVFILMRFFMAPCLFIYAMAADIITTLAAMPSADFHDAAADI